MHVKNKRNSKFQKKCQRERKQKKIVIVINCDNIYSLIPESAIGNQQLFEAAYSVIFVESTVQKKE